MVVFVINPDFFKFLKDDTTVEKEPLKLLRFKEIQAFKHEGFWQCMDHKLDKDYLEELVIKMKHLG